MQGDAFFVADDIDQAELRRRGDDALAEGEAEREILQRMRRGHHHGEGLAVVEQRHRRFDDHAVVVRRAGIVAQAQRLHRLQRVVHVVWHNCRPFAVSHSSVRSPSLALLDQIQAVEALIAAQCRQQPLQFAQAQPEPFGDPMDRLAILLRQQAQQRQRRILAHGPLATVIAQRPRCG